MKESNRNYSYDILKFVAIFLVCWGHSIQYLHCDESYWNNTVWETIYSFHMPLFFFMSGIFTFSSIKKYNFKAFLIKRTKMLLLPYLVWHILDYLVQIFIFKAYDGIELKFGWLWFLLVLYICELLAYILISVYRKNHIFSFLMLVVVLLVPKIGRIAFYLIILLVGCIYQYLCIKCSDKVIVIITVFAFLCVILLLPFFKGIFYITFFDTYEFIRGNYWGCLNHLMITIYKLGIGISISILLVYFANVLERLCIPYRPRIINIGQNTMEIYILQSLLLEKLCPMIFNCSKLQISNIYHFILYSFLITPIVAFLLFIICYWLGFLLKRITILKFTLFGCK